VPAILSAPVGRFPLGRHRRWLLWGAWHLHRVQDRLGLRWRPSLWSAGARTRRPSRSTWRPMSSPALRNWHLASCRAP